MTQSIYIILSVLLLSVTAALGQHEKEKSHNTHDSHYSAHTMHFHKHHFALFTGVTSFYKKNKTFLGLNARLQQAY